MRILKRAIIIATISLLLILSLTAAYLSNDETTAALVVFESDALFVDAAALIEELDLNILNNQIHHRYTMGDSISATIYYDQSDRENVQQFIANEWERIDSSVDGRIDSWLRRDRETIAATGNRAINSGQIDSYIRDKAIFDQTIKGCWEDLTCPSIGIEKIYLATITQDQLTALEQSQSVKEVRTIPGTRTFLPILTNEFEWQPDEGMVESYEQDDGDRFIRISATWNEGPALDDIKERGFFTLRLGLNTSINSQYGPDSYIDHEAQTENAKVITDSNFPASEFGNYRGRFAEQSFQVRGYELQNLQPGIDYYGEWRKKKTTEPDRDNGDMIIGVGQAIDCFAFYCRLRTHVCEVNNHDTDQFGIEPIPGIYTWTKDDIPDDQCRTEWTVWIPFIN